MTIKKLYVVFSLEEAISGISNTGIKHSEYSFTLGTGYKNIFNNAEDCENYIRDTMVDYKKRNVGEKTRFVILPIFCYDDDEIFTDN